MPGGYRSDGWGGHEITRADLPRQLADWGGQNHFEPRRDERGARCLTAGVEMGAAPRPFGQERCPIRLVS